MAEKIKLNFEIDGLKDANKQLEKLESTAEDLKKQLDGVEEGSDAFKSLNKELTETNKQMGLIKDATGQIGLDETFEDALGEAKPLNTQLGELEDRMYALAAAGLENTEGFRALQEEVVGIRQTIIRVDESVDDLAANKGISTFGDQVTDLGASLLKLDFERAAKQGEGLGKAIKGFDLGKAVKGVKNLGSVFINLGKALLTNPIFLIAAVIAAVVAAVVALMKKLGILKPILDAIGKVFGWIGDAIDAVVQGFKDFTDWLGITNNAAEEFAETQAKNAQKAAESSAESTNKIVQDLDQQIRMLELEGMESEKQIRKRQDLEKQKLKAISDTAAAELKASKEALKAAKVKGDLDAEEMKALRQKVKENRLAYQATVNDIKFANKAAEKEIADFNQRIKDEKDAEDQRIKDEEAAQRKERAARAKQWRADRLSAERQSEDLRLELIEDDHERELELNRVKFERLREDTKNATNLTRQEKLALEEYYNQLEIQKNKELIDKKAADEKAAADKAAAESEAEQLALIDKAVQGEKMLSDMKIQAMEEGFDKERAVEEARYQEELTSLQNALDNKLLTEQQYFEAVDIATAEHNEKKAATDEAELAREQELQDLKKEMALQATMGLLGGINDLVQAFAGKSEAAQKKAFKVNKAFQIAEATVSTIKGGISAFTGMVSQIPGPVGIVLGAVAAAGVVASGVASIKKIADTKFMGSGGGGATPNIPKPSGGGAGGAGGAPTPPSINLFGQANAGSEGIGQQEAGLRQQPVVKAVVVESDITNTQNRLDTYQQRSEIG